MKFEKQLYDVVKSLGYPTYWVFKNLNEPNTSFPLIVISYISDEQPIYIDSLDSAKKGRITFTVFAKKEADILNIKESLRDLLLRNSNTTQFNFYENSGLTHFHENSKTFAYQLDFNYIFTGDE